MTTLYEDLAETEQYDSFGTAPKEESTVTLSEWELNLIGEALDASNALLDQLERAEAEKKEKKNLKQARIRVYLSRPLTWAEKEHLETNHDDPQHRRVRETVSDLSVRVSKDMQHVWVDGYLGSRVLFELVSAALEQHFVNVFPKAVRTFTEYNGE